MRKEMKTNKELFELLIARLNDYVIVLTDPEGNFRSWHPGVERQLGYKADEFTGKNGEILLSLEHRLKGAWRRELQTAAEAGAASDTSWLVTKSGRSILVEGVLLAIRDSGSGELLGFGKVLHDVTERKTTENSLKTLARTLDQSVVFIRNWNGVIEHWTSGCQRLYGWTEHEAVGRVADELLQTTELAWSVIEEQLLTDGAWHGELNQKRKDGTDVCVSAHWILLSDKEDGRSSIIATHTDITARLQMQRDLENANERLKNMALELERSNAELEEFARIASHDLSAPITSTRWLVDLLSARHGKNLDSDGRFCLNQISLGLERMNDLIEAILAHAQMGKTAIGATQPIPAGAALNIAIGNLQKDINTSEATLTHQPLPRLLIEAQPLAQLFQNLLSNAIKYRRRDVPLQISIEAVHKSSMWVLSDRDNGLGIEPAWHERIFQPMQRHHGADIAGSGIGLATCRKIVNRAGGRIWVESESGSGSTFYFSLPGPAD
ncbi:MAG: PAS domain S-box protein [Acidobacteriota bacterium]|nr:PAS domain S-box protein [Acidobacteriota bacterium]